MICVVIDQYAAPAFIWPGRNSPTWMSVHGMPRMTAAWSGVDQ